MKLPLILVDDPLANTLFDLRRVLAGRGPCELIGVVEPLATTAPAGDGATPAPKPSADGIEAASATTAGSPIDMPHYRVVPARAKNGNVARPIAVEDVVAEMLQLARPPFAVVVFVTPHTLPVLEALHADARTRGLLKLGITGVRFDRNYNMARKLFADGKLDYHEHSLALPKVLNRRLELMIHTHAAPKPAVPAPAAEAEAPATATAAPASPANAPPASSPPVPAASTSAPAAATSAPAASAPAASITPAPAGGATGEEAS